MPEVRFRPIEREDLALIQRWRNNPELRQYFRTWRDFSMADQEAFYESLCGNEKMLYWFVESVTDPPAPVGVAGWTFVDKHNRRCELSLYVGNDALRGKGYGLAILDELHRIAFEDLNMHKVELECFSYNPACDIYIKYGYSVVGRWRERHFQFGSYHDTVLMDLLATEWFTGRGKQVCAGAKGNEGLL